MSTGNQEAHSLSTHCDHVAQYINDSYINVNVIMATIYHTSLRCLTANEMYTTSNKHFMRFIGKTYYFLVFSFCRIRQGFRRRKYHLNILYKCSGVQISLLKIHFKRAKNHSKKVNLT